MLLDGTDGCNGRPRAARALMRGTMGTVAVVRPGGAAPFGTCRAAPNGPVAGPVAMASTRTAS